MQVKVTSVFFWAFLLVAWSDARPQELGSAEVIPGMAKDSNNLTTRTNSQNVRSRLVAPGKEYQHMDQSLKTVATQLLNVSDSDNLHPAGSPEKLESRLGLLIRKPEPINQEISPNRETTVHENIEIGSVDTSMNFGRYSNSKFNYFEISHPGQAMAMTEEELEKELTATRHPKPKPTTTAGGLSTWILLHPPSTTLQSTDSKDQEDRTQETKVTWKPTKPTSPPVKIDTTLKTDLKTTVSLSKVSTVQSTPKSINQSSSTPEMEKVTTTSRPETTEAQKLDVATARSDNREENEVTTLKTTTKKTVSSSWSLKPNVTMPHTTTVISKATTIKVVRPNRPPKPTVVRKPSAKPDISKSVSNSTSKIEKVTFKPVQMIPTPKIPTQTTRIPSQTSRPMFITKMQASLSTATNEKASNASLRSEDVAVNNSSFEPAAKSRTKPNNVLKVQLKKPSDSVTTIEIDPIKVNAPVLTIQRIEETKKNNELDPNSPIVLNDSKIDVKFDFNPELTKIIESSTENSLTTTTTKKPKIKRKKNKVRRRKPSSTTPTSVPTPAALSLEVDDELTNETGVSDASLQESKIVSDSQVLSNETKNKKKQSLKNQKPISTQIYNFLSRDVMPSFGVMSLVGLGLGLASYFFYPFSGTIARRNGYADPHHKYNLEEYGGNYGQNEEEVFSKVLQGMSVGDGKYGGMKDYENNYYRYQAYDGAYTDPYTTRRADVKYPTSAVPIYRPDNTRLPYDSKYRKTDFLYPDIPTTPNYYERPTKTEFLNNPGVVDRQFVVGNVPKEYSYEDKRRVLTTTTESVQTDFEKQMAQSLKFVKDPVNIPENFSQAEAQALKQEGYEDIEITPSAVAVEHGPRSLKFEKSQQPESMAKDSIKIRRKRDSNIQFIPPRGELEKTEQEEDLSNEILDIIDSAIPTKVPDMIQAMTGVRDDLKTAENEKTMQENTSKPLDKEEMSLTDETTKKLEEPESSEPGLIEKFSTTITFATSTMESPPPSSSSSDESTTDQKKLVTSTSTTTMPKPIRQNFNFFDFVRKLAEIKFRVGLTVLKHASEGFAKYLGNVQKQLNGEAI